MTGIIGWCLECHQMRWLLQVKTHDTSGSPMGICKPCNRKLGPGEVARGGKVYSRESQCEGKLKWPRKVDAKRHLKRARQFEGRDRIRPYRCPWCGYWHLGGKVKKQAQPVETRYTESNEPLGGGER